ncbi:MAG: serine/threonine protein kinase [Planctomycetota bacterium]
MTESAGPEAKESETFLGTIVVREGFADAETIVKHVRMQLAERERGIFRPFGEYLVDKGVITSDQLRRCLRLQRGDAGRSAKISALREPGDPRSSAAVSHARSKTVKKTRKMMGQYELLGKIGQGAMGTVYLAYDTEKKVDVALKVLPKDLADDPEFVARFNREAELASKVQHPNLVLAYGTGTHKGYHYIAFEYVSGGSLDFHLERTGPLSEKRALLIARDIAHALQAASDHGIVHRDMKPDNIILDRDGTAKLTDLGLSMAYDPGDPRLTAPGMAIGTPFYISPELARGVRDVDVRSDLYSLGATLYHIVTGQVPYESENSVQVMMAHIKEPIPRCREKRPELSPGLEALIMKLMAKKPEERYQSCTEVLQAIERVLDGKMPDEAEPAAKKVEIREGKATEVRRPRKIGSTDKFKRVTQTGRQAPVGETGSGERDGAGSGSKKRAGAAAETDSDAGSGARAGERTGSQRGQGKTGKHAKAGGLTKTSRTGKVADADDAGSTAGRGGRPPRPGTSRELASVPEVGDLDATADDLADEEIDDEEEDPDEVPVESEGDDEEARDDGEEGQDEEDEDARGRDRRDDPPTGDTVEVGVARSSHKRSTRGASGNRGDSVRESGRRPGTRRTRKLGATVRPEAGATEEDAAPEGAARGGMGKWLVLAVVLALAGLGLMGFLLGWFKGH